MNPFLGIDKARISLVDICALIIRRNEIKNLKLTVDLN